MNRWSQYNKNTKNRKPRELYLEALEFVKLDNPQALDIAAGPLNETKDMVARGFNVTAFDSNKEVKLLAKSVDSKNLHTEISTMQNYDYGHDKHDLIIAMFALPFIKPEDFHQTFKKIVSSLKRNGIFAFHLFGAADGWASNKNMTFHNPKSVNQLLDGLAVLKLKEINEEAPVADGSTKHWHIFEVIVTK